MSQLTTVCFDGDNLQAVREDGRVWVVVKRVCEALGLANAAQHQKLKQKPWAVVSTIETTGPDGKNYEMFCLDLDSLPMWLATIEPRRVAEHVRPKLNRYQCECAKVLRDHFFGRRQAESARSVDTDVLALLVAKLMHHLEASEARSVAFEARVLERLDGLERRGLGSCITSLQHRQLQAAVRNVAVLEVACGRCKDRRQASSGLWKAIGQACGWGGSGQSFRIMPAAQFPVATGVLNSRHADATRMLDLLNQRRQTRFWDDAPANDNARSDDGDTGDAGDRKTKH